MASETMLKQINQVLFATLDRYTEIRDLENEQTFAKPNKPDLYESNEKVDQVMTDYHQFI